MNEQDVIDLINQIVVENHNREITGSELNAVLLAMVQQPNDAIGDLDSLSTGVNTDLVSAINWLLTQINSGAVIHSGEPDPNITPPSSFAVGDLYSRLDVMSNPIQLYIYTGVEWALLSSSSVITGFNTTQFIYNGTDNEFELPPEANSIAIATINKGITYDFTFDPITKIATLTDPEMYSGDLIQIRYSY